MASQPAPAAPDRRYPRVIDLAQRARRRLPYFIADYLDGGTGAELSGARNRAALDAVELVPRYLRDMGRIDASAEIMGRRFAAPLAFAPVGMDGAIWPGATRHIARAARDCGLPYMTGSFATAPLEEVAGALDGQLWFQLYSLPGRDHAITLDLVRRAEAAGVTALAVTVDIPLAGRRPRDMRNGIRLPQKPTPRMIAGVAARPAWAAALLREGMPHYANIARYHEGADKAAVARAVARGGAGSGVDWTFLARLRDAWPRALLVKGILHPADARRIRALGCEGVVVSNHGGRQFDAAPAPVDVLPAIREALGGEATVLMDSGILSGLDMLKAVALGADGVLIGRAAMLGLAALGPAGPRHVAETIIAEYRVALGQSGALDIAGARRLALRHPGRWAAADFGSQGEDEA